MTVPLPPLPGRCGIGGGRSSIISTVAWRRRESDLASGLGGGGGGGGSSLSPGGKEPGTGGVDLTGTVISLLVW